MRGRDRERPERGESLVEYDLRLGWVFSENVREGESGLLFFEPNGKQNGGGGGGGTMAVVDDDGRR